MLALTYYILKVIICSAILFGYYWFFLRNKIFHIYNRFYLLATVALSLIVPLIRFNIQHTSTVAKTSAIHLLQFVNGGDEYMDEIVIQSHYNHISKEQVLLWVFIAVCSFFAFFLGKSVVKIYILKRNNPVQVFDGLNIITTEDRSTPFSFFKDIFWNNAIDINTESGKRILKHEIAHVQEKHSQDKLFINIVMIVFWCNPVFWLIRKELNLIHEFLADKKAVEDGDTSAFAAMILQTTYPGHHFEIANNFFYSPIKRRLAMLTKNNKTKVNYISRLLVLPLALVVFAAFTLKTKTVTTSSLLKNKTITVVLDAGHGGTDNGVKAVDGSFEKDINLDLVKKIQALNNNANIKIILTRETDIYQSPKEKAAIAKENNADLFISVHGDFAPGDVSGKSSGLNVLFSKDKFENNLQSRILASSILNSFKNNYGLNVSPNPEQRQHGIWVLQANTFPSVLIEAGVLSNKKDIAYLKSVEGKELFAKNVLASIKNYAASNIKINDYSSEAISDTTPTKQMEVHKEDVKVIGNVSINLKKSSQKLQQTLFIINGKEYSSTEIADKQITSKLAKIYQKDNVEMIGKYGTKAKNGVIILDGAIITDTPTSKIKFSSDSIYWINASKKSTDKKSAANKLQLSKALFIIDGKEEQYERLENILPNTIESITVLNDKDALNKYGNKGKNGVVEITLKDITDTIPQKDNKIFTKVEQEAQFPGGSAAWANYLRGNLNSNIPVDEGWKDGTYTLIVQFIVDKDGSLSEIKTDNYPGSKTARECIRIISKGPKWVPAKQNGHIVTSYRKQPITFVVSKS